jgi:hypothetical protein
MNKLVVFCVFVMITVTMSESTTTFEVSDCNILSTCKKCTVKEFEIYNVCKETGFYQLVNCTLNRIENVNERVSTFRITREGCKLNEFHSSIQQFYTTFIFEMVMLLLMIFSCFYFYKRKNYLFNSRQERYERLVTSQE